MNSAWKLFAVIALMMALCVAILLRKPPPPPPSPPASVAEPLAMSAPEPATRTTPPLVTSLLAANATKLPMLIDLGAEGCVPCRQMMPELEALQKGYAGKLAVVILDVWKKPELASQLGIASIPSQIFFDGSGKELFRHTGAYSKDEMVAKWKELGVDLGVEKVGTP